MQETKQASMQARGLATQFKAGTSGNVNGKGSPRVRREKLLAELASEFPGGLDAMPPSDRERLKQAADLLANGVRTRQERDRVAAINTADRLLRRLHASALKRQPAAAKPVLPLSELLRQAGKL
jgi:hypothetical protein